MRASSTSTGCRLGARFEIHEADLNLKSVSTSPLLGPMLIRRPLKADPVPVRVPERELPHSVRSHPRRFHAYTTGSQMFVSTIQFTASEIQPDIGMSSGAFLVRSRRAVL